MGAGEQGSDYILLAVFSYTWTEDDIGLQHDSEMVDKGNALVRLRGAENCVVDG